MYQLKDLIKTVNENQAEIHGRWIPARPINWQFRSFFERLREAWAVFVGKADAVVWPEGQ